MNRGTPPTGPNARTGEFTPPGVTWTARANSSAERSSVKESAFFLKSVDQVFKQPQPVRKRPARGLAHPAYVLARAVPGRRGQHIAVTAVPAHGFRLLG